MAAGDAGGVCSEVPAWRPETPALCVMQPQSSCEEFPFSEALNEDGCSLWDVFLLLVSDSRAFSLLYILRKISPPLPFFPVYLLVSLSCQLYEWPCTSTCSTLRSPLRQLSSGLSSAIHTKKRLLSQRSEKKEKKNLPAPKVHSWAKWSSRNVHTRVIKFLGTHQPTRESPCKCDRCISCHCVIRERAHDWKKD